MLNVSAHTERKRDGGGKRSFQETGRSAHSPQANELPPSGCHLEGGISLPLATPTKGASELKSCDTEQVTRSFYFQLLHP